MYMECTWMIADWYSTSKHPIKRTQYTVTAGRTVTDGGTERTWCAVWGMPVWPSDLWVRQTAVQSITTPQWHPHLSTFPKDSRFSSAARILTGWHIRLISDAMGFFERHSPIGCVLYITDRSLLYTKFCNTVRTNPTLLACFRTYFISAQKFG